MENKTQHIVIIGGGIGGLGTACLLAKKGYKVSLFEKNKDLGGRARLLRKEGFTFDMGPSWYLMPDVFEHFFELLGENISTHLTLEKLSPSYRVFFPGDTKHPFVDIYSDIGKDLATLEAFEPGVGPTFTAYLERSGRQYELAKSLFMYRNYNSIFDFIQKDFIREGVRMNPFQTMEKYLDSWFKDERLKKILEYTLVFLGSEPAKTPALYNIMNYIDFEMGVYYPQGGIYTVIESLIRIAKKYKVSIHTDSPVKEIVVKNGIVKGVMLEGGERIDADVVVSNADMWFTETKMLPRQYQTYKESYWKKQTIGPSAFILYLGMRGRVEGLIHHNLRFSNNWTKNFEALFDNPSLPTDPSYYVCCPTKTDSSLAPEGKDLLFVLVPLASGLTLNQEMKKEYRDKIIMMMKDDLSLPQLEEMIEVEESYWQEDFEKDYNAYKGTALGLAHTLKQTLLRPHNMSKKVKNLYYVGAGTNPGIGMPICLISSELVYKRIEGITSPEPLSKL